MKKMAINRILVALDTSTANRHILQAAITLANRLNAQLNALFIEDADLLKAAELPFVREVTYGSSSGKTMNVAGMERSIASQTARLRKLVETIAQQNQIKIPFDVLRGNVAHELCNTPGRSDLLVIGKNTLTLGKSQKIGSITRLVLSSAGCNLAVLQYGCNIERPVVVSFSGSEASQRALLLAIELAHEDHNQLIVILPAVDDVTYRQLCRMIQEKIVDQRLQVSLARLQENSAEQILSVIQQFHGRIFLVESDNTFLTQLQKQALVMQANIPVILLR